jgi:hypothetical protein
MRLTWRDGVSTMLVLACGVIFFAVTDAWGWPLLSSFGAGSAALLVVGLAACIVGGSNMKTFDTSDPMVVGSSTIGVFAFAVAIYGIINGSETAFAILATTIAVLWVVTTIHHELENDRHHEHHPVAHA